MQIHNLQRSNRLLTLSLKSYIPISIIRPGWDDTYIPYAIRNKQSIHPSGLTSLNINAGIYFRTPDLNHPKDK